METKDQILHLVVNFQKINEIEQTCDSIDLKSSF